MKRLEKKYFLFLALFLLLSLPNWAQANPRYASIVIDAKTSAVLHESRADASRYPASLTKMMTLYMLFETMQQGKKTLNTQMQVSSRAASMPQTNIRLRRGDSISVRQAISALIVRSANDVAVVVAEALGGSEIKFARMMTKKAQQLGMRATTFKNASGLPNRKQKTTARDMVILAERLLKDFPQHYHYFSTRSFKYKGVIYNSHNHMVRNIKSVDGMKTGYIHASGFNVATSAKRDTRRVIAVVMGGKAAASRDRHMARLLDRTLGRATAGFNRHATRLRMVAFVPVPKFKPGSEPKFRLTPELKPVFSQAKETELTVRQRTIPTDISVKPQKVAMTHNNDWAVQVGIYQEHNNAWVQAYAAARWVAGRIVVSEVKLSNQKMYRARLEGLQENQAHMACQSLFWQGMDCMVVQ